MSTMGTMNSYRKGILFFGDIAGLVGGFLLFILIAFGKAQFAVQAQLHAIPLLILAIIWIGVFFVFNFYDAQHAKPNLIFLRNFGIVALIMLGIGFIFFYFSSATNIAPKTNLLIFEGISLVLILIWRRLFYLATSKIFHTRFAIVCADGRHQVLVEQVISNPQLGYQFAGSFKTLSEFYQANIPIDLLIVHKTTTEETELLEKTLGSEINVISLAEAYEDILYKIPVHFIDSGWVIHSVKKQGNFFYQAISRIISIVFALLVLIATSPFTLIIMIAIKLEDGGPLFIRQERVGLHGKIFKLYKFRSMIVLGADGQAETGKSIWSPGEKDPRITKVGKVTRKLHIDELAQMINVLKGDLTLVGPRPERPDFVVDLEKEIPYYFMRHTIKPGFTGWAQIKFRYARTVMDSQEKFEYDLYYIKNRNLFLDFGIVLKTVQIIFTH